ncbi:CE1759 family FMN reductase [Corynebacterium hindlerae]|uniref:CE1759 family FMN reductase n=1 Tax=Corynebacterium hindlerae TaxID=699041 RepID=UPI003AABB424
MHHLVVINAGLSTPSSSRTLAEQLAAATTAALSTRGEASDIHYIDLRDLVMDLAQSFTNPGFSSPKLSAAIERTESASALIVVTPIYKASYSGVFKMFFDIIDQKAIIDKPVLMGATAGSPRHSLVLEHAVRPLFSYLRARTIATAVFAATEDFGGSNELGDRIVRAAGELATSLTSVSTTVGGLGGAFARSGEPDDLDAGSFADRVKKYN